MKVIKASREKSPESLDAVFEGYLNSRSEEDLSRVADAGSRLVYHFANLYAPGRPTEDAVQAGFEGLLKAAARFDPGRGVTFTTYAGHCIMGEIRHHLRKEASFDRAGWVAELQGKVSRAVEDHLKQTGQAPSLSQIAEAVNVQEEGVLEAMRAGWVSLDEIDTAKIKHLRYESFKLPIEDKIALEQAMDKLSILQRRVIKLLFYSNLTQTEAAAELGLSQRKVSRLLRKSLSQLAESMT